jgi:hypothetical protein
MTVYMLRTMDKESQHRRRKAITTNRSRLSQFSFVDRPKLFQRTIDTLMQCGHKLF